MAGPYEEQTTARIFAFGSEPETRALIVDANGGSVEVAVWSGQNFIPADTYSADTGTEYFTRNMKLRITPTGGAAYAIDRTNIVSEEAAP